MPTTREQREELRLLIKDIFTEMFSDEEFLSSLVKRASEKLGLQKIINSTSQKVTELEKENLSLKRKIDELEQHSRKSNLRINGIDEVRGEDLNKTVLSVLRDKMQIDVKNEDISLCHRIGKQENQKRPIILKLASLRLRQQILANRRFLRKTTIFISEDLTTERYKLLKICRSTFGGKSVWVSNGTIRVKVTGGDGGPEECVGVQRHYTCKGDRR
ncbi:hypothetical protein QE152_g15953 [Popillia japonica]|uniref:Uncharacterized protein n=1 Tax=Popillia japonica TaxID=7064 RepID=A0AAW1L4C0_POPJA